VDTGNVVYHESSGEIMSTKKYTPEFKREAVRMMTEGGLSVPAVSQKLGVTENQLYAWRKKARLEGEAAFPGSGHLSPIEEENRRLKTEVKRLEMERDILKKASAFFASQMK
jgi:transposase